MDLMYNPCHIKIVESQSCTNRLSIQIIDILMLNCASNFSIPDDSIWHLEAPLWYWFWLLLLLWHLLNLLLHSQDFRHQIKSALRGHNSQKQWLNVMISQVRYTSHNGKFFLPMLYLCSGKKKKRKEKRFYFYWLSWYRDERPKGLNPHKPSWLSLKAHHVPSSLIEIMDLMYNPCHIKIVESQSCTNRLSIQIIDILMLNCASNFSIPDDSIWHLEAPLWYWFWLLLLLWHLLNLLLHSQDFRHQIKSALRGHNSQKQWLNAMISQVRYTSHNGKFFSKS